MTTLARVAFALLIAATFAAFFVAQQLKSAPSFINRVDVVEHFSPVCKCPQSVQVLRFRLKESDDVTVDVVDLAGGRVARVAMSPTFRRSAPRSSSTARTASAMWMIGSGVARASSSYQ